METLHLPETPNKAALDRIERVIAYKNVQFIIDHQHDTLEQLSAYLKTCMDELGHVPAKVEVIGGDYLEYRFGTWRKALGSFYSGSIASSKNPPPFAARKIVRDLYALGGAAMNPHRTCQENMDALKKVLTQRTLLALSRRNVEFVLAHQADSKQQLADYLRQCRAELGHIPGRTEVIGGDLIELRFRGWANALCASGVPAEQAVRRVHPALTKTDLFQKEFEAQRQLDKRTKAERKKANLEQAKQDKLRRKAGR